MKSTGIVRKVDELGRIVLPIEMRRTLDIAEKDALEIYVDATTSFFINSAARVYSAAVRTGLSALRNAISVPRARKN